MGGVGAGERGMGAPVDGGCAVGGEGGWERGMAGVCGARAAEWARRVYRRGGVDGGGAAVPGARELARSDRGEAGGSGGGAAVWTRRRISGVLSIAECAERGGEARAG